MALNKSSGMITKDYKGEAVSTRPVGEDRDDPIARFTKLIEKFSTVHWNIKTLCNKERLDTADMVEAFNLYGEEVTKLYDEMGTEE